MLTFAVIIWFYPPTGDFRIDNPFWNGLQTLTKQEKVTPLNSLSDLPATAKGTALIIVPYDQFTETELAQIKNYVTNGGTLILLDDYGYGNHILGTLNTGIKFSGQPLIDPLFNYQNKMLPKITDFTKDSIAKNVSSIVFNHATALEVTNATVVAYSSSFSFLDTNTNQVWEETEKTGSQPVIAFQQIRQGYIIAVADPSVIINSMINLDDNLQLIKNTASIQNSNPQIYLDQSHLTNTALDQTKTTLKTIYEGVSSTTGTILLVTALLAATFYPIIKKVKK